jgi:tetratricopeptide (TPR) repeat protein
MLRLRIVLFLMIALMACPTSHADCPFPPDSYLDQAFEFSTNEIQSGRLSTNSRATAYTARAEIWNKKGEFDRALSDSNKALDLDPDYVNALSSRGLAWQGKGEYDKAIDDYSRAITLIQGGIHINTDTWWPPAVHMRRGSAWGLKGDLDRSIADSNEAIRLNPEEERAFYNRGLAWKLKGDYDKAVADYEKAIALNPADPRVLMKTPKNWSRMSKAEQAEALFKGLTFSGIVSTSPGVTRVYDVQQTRFGKILIVGTRRGSGEPDTVLFNGQKIFEEPAMYLQVHARSSIGNEDVLVLGVNCGGSGCRYDDLSLLILNEDRQVKVLRTQDFYSEDNSIKAGLKGDEVVIDLGLYKGKRKAAVYGGNEIKIHYTRLPQRPLQAEQCAKLYEIARGCVGLGRSTGITCERSAVGFHGGANSTAWALRYVSNEPGFDQELFDAECLNACKTGTLSDYDRFAERLCGRIMQERSPGSE